MHYFFYASLYDVFTGSDNWIAYSKKNKTHTSSRELEFAVNVVMYEHMNQTIHLSVMELVGGIHDLEHLLP